MLGRHVEKKLKKIFDKVVISMQKYKIYISYTHTHTIQILYDITKYENVINCYLSSEHT